jgi:hypothetical protein
VRDGFGLRSRVALARALEREQPRQLLLAVGAAAVALACLGFARMTAVPAVALAILAGGITALMWDDRLPWQLWPALGLSQLGAASAPWLRDVFDRCARPGLRWLCRQQATLAVIAPAALLVTHALCADSELFGLNSTRHMRPAARIAVLGSGVALAFAAPARRRLRRLVQALVGHWGRVPAGLRGGLVACLATAAFLGFRCQNFTLGDSGGLVTATEITPNWNEPLEHLAHIAAQRILETVAGVPSLEWAYALTSAAAGVAYVFLPGLLAREMGLQGAARALLVGTLLTGGTMQLFFGYVEDYSLAALAQSVYLIAGVRCARLGTGLLGAACLLGVAAACHGGNLTLGLSLLFLCLRVPHAGHEARGGWLLRGGVWLRLLGAGASFLLPIAVVELLMSQRGLGLESLTSRDSPGGADHSMFVPLWSLSTPQEHATLFSTQHLLDVLNEVVLVSPMLLGMLLLCSCVGKADRRSPPDERFLLLAAAGQLLLLLFWNPDLGAARDWDLLSAHAYPLTAFAATRLARTASLPVVEDAALLYPLSSAMVTLPWILGNTSRTGL